MPVREPNRLSAVDARSLLAGREPSAEQLAQACLARALDAMMHGQRRCYALRSFIMICLFPGLSGTYVAAADMPRSFPNKPIRWIIPFVAGGGVDAVIRPVAQKLSEAIGQSVVVDNRGGASGAVGAELVARSPPDGYTLLAISSTLAANQAMNPHSSYGLTRDFAAISLMTSQAYAFAVPTLSPLHSVADLIALAKAKPGTFIYGSSGVGSLQHLSVALVAINAGIELLHVPYKGGGEVRTDLMAGRVQLQATLPLASLPLVKAGRLRYIAVTSLKRMAALPDVPAVSETLPGYDVVSWYGVVAPKNTPPNAITILNREIVQVLKLPEIGGRFLADGTEPIGTSAAEFASRIAKEIEKWREITQKAGIRVE